MDVYSYLLLYKEWLCHANLFKSTLSQNYRNKLDAMLTFKTCLTKQTFFSCRYHASNTELEKPSNYTMKDITSTRMRADKW